MSARQEPVSNRLTDCKTCNYRIAYIPVHQRQAQDVVDRFHHHTDLNTHSMFKLSDINW